MTMPFTAPHLCPGDVPSVDFPHWDTACVLNADMTRPPKGRHRMQADYKRRPMIYLARLSHPPHLPPVFVLLKATSTGRRGYMPICIHGRDGFVDVGTYHRLSASFIDHSSPTRRLRHGERERILTKLEPWIRKLCDEQAFRSHAMRGQQ